MEVVYTGLRQTPEMIAEAVLQEDVQAVGVSILSGAHNALVPRVIKQLQEQDLAHVPLFVGGIIPDDDVAVLLKLGVAAVFGPGTPTTEIIAAVRAAIEGAAEHASS
jgi:methylmalonyl-CoA mutase C-terminal domain/subunit